MNRSVTTSDIIASYEDCGSVRGVTQALHVSWSRVVKALVADGSIINDDHKRILELHGDGLSAAEIAERLHCSVGKVEAYLPRTRPLYGEQRSKNAERIDRCRKIKGNGAHGA